MIVYSKNIIQKQRYKMKVGIGCSYGRSNMRNTILFSDGTYKEMNFEETRK